jgi:hypothetical protein
MWSVLSPRVPAAAAPQSYTRAARLDRARRRRTIGGVSRMSRLDTSVDAWVDRLEEGEGDEFSATFRIRTHLPAGRSCAQPTHPPSTRRSVYQYQRDEPLGLVDEESEQCMAPPMTT